MPWPLYIAFKQLFPTGRGVSFVLLISVTGVTLGVLVMLATQTVMNSYGARVKQSIIETRGHIEVSSRGILYDPEPVEDILREHPDVAAYTAYAQGMVMLLKDDRPAFPAVRGIDFATVDDVTPVERFLVQGSLDDLDDDRVILSIGMANKLSANVGDEINVFSPLMLERMTRDTLFLPRELEVCGIYESGSELDSSLIIVTLRTMQELYGLDGGIHGYTLRLAEGKSVERVARELNEELPPEVVALTYIEANSQLLFILGFEKTIMLFLNLFIVLVAAFSIASTLFSTALRKTREIGLLNAMGGQPRKVASIFCLEGFLVGAVGSVLGASSAVMVLTFKFDIIAFLGWITGQSDTLQQYYPFLDFENMYRFSDFAVIIGFTLFFSTLAGLIPAWRAANLKPSVAMRYE